MNVRKHHDEVCPWCGICLWYGVKEEPAGWKVFYTCHSSDGCGREWYAGYVRRAAIETYDDVFARAEELAPVD